MGNMKSNVKNFKDDSLVGYDIQSLRDIGYERNKKRNKRKNKLECNICGKNFYPSNKFERYCQKCRDESEEYKMDYWN